ncbi:MAG: hypothetical protein AABZ00_10895 [Chloroflexota bacterium]|jgi:hypothetical protein
MRIEKISFPGRDVNCVFPRKHSDLEEAVSELQLQTSCPVIVLIGGGIDEQQSAVTRQAIQAISRVAEDMNASIICGGTDMGVMAEIGLVRWQNRYKFQLVGISLEELVAWPDGPASTKFLWWGKERWQLAEHYSHFILVPGEHFSEESPWIVETATILSKGSRSVTILINGGEVSGTDIKLSLEHGRPVIALSGTGRLADELDSQLNRNSLITMVPANSGERIVAEIRAALLDDGEAEALNFETEKLSSFN